MMSSTASSQGVASSWFNLNEKASGIIGGGDSTAETATVSRGTNHKETTTTISSSSSSDNKNNKVRSYPLLKLSRRRSKSTENRPPMTMKEKDDGRGLRLGRGRSLQRKERQQGTQRSNRSNSKLKKGGEKIRGEDARVVIAETRGERSRSSNTASERSPPPSASSIAAVVAAHKSTMKVVDTTTKGKTTKPAINGDRRQKKVVFNEFSNKPLETLQLEISDIPEPLREDHVVVKVLASTVSLHDCMIRKGVSFHSSAEGECKMFPQTPGMDIVGDIVSCGKAIRSVHVGDRVAALVRVGGNARYISIAESSLVQVPRGLDSAEAACMVTTYMTAYQTIRKVTRNTFSLDGKRVLVTGSTEPVGHALIQLCSRAGALELYATAPKSHHRYVKGLGASPLPPEPEEWLPLVKGRMDVVFDGTCQDDLSSTCDAVRDDECTVGILVCLGMTNLLARESSPGVFGAPLSAYIAQFKRHLIPNALVYDVWESYLQDRNSFKVRTRSCKLIGLL